MIVLMKDNATQKQVNDVLGRIEELGYTPHPSLGAKKMVIGIIG
ncbi:MAG: 3-deoxy-7-phosphoheptulonate synthase, partial [Halanaerobiales bacterium]